MMRRASTGQGKNMADGTPHGRTPGRPRAFTLIELLIVVAIIAILAAIAVPNFQEAMTRAKVARAENDMRSIGIALESYRLDNPNYPPENYLSPFLEPSEPKGIPALPNHIRLRPLTTPIAYLSALPRDPFASIEDDLNRIWPPTYHYAAYLDLLYPDAPFFRGKNPEGLHCEWICQSNGPDRSPHSWQWPRYDPTNGTFSEGNILRTGP